MREPEHKPEEGSQNQRRGFRECLLRKKREYFRARKESQCSLGLMQRVQPVWHNGRVQRVG